VPTATRDANGFAVAAMPLLDRRVTIPLGNRRVSESAKLWQIHFLHRPGRTSIVAKVWLRAFLGAFFRAI
jgi:hypothetical protein